MNENVKRLATLDLSTAPDTAPNGRRVSLMCKKDEHLEKIAVVEGAHFYTTGFWKMKKSKALALVGGELFLHRTGADRSYFGGRIISVNFVDEKAVFTFVVSNECRDVKCGGAWGIRSSVSHW